MSIENLDIFDISSYTFPFTQEDLRKVVDNAVIIGYYGCPYDNLINTINQIMRSDSFEVTKNVDVFYQDANRPDSASEVVFAIEGQKTYGDIYTGMIKNGSISFTTYSENFKDTLRRMKIAAYKKFLWNSFNLNKWLTNHSIELPSDYSNELYADFDIFKNIILNGNDYKSYIACCDEKEIIAFEKGLRNALVKHLKKHFIEFMKHIGKLNKDQERFVLDNPVIKQIYVVNTIAQRVKKDWPALKFIPITKKNFDIISLWGE